MVSYGIRLVYANANMEFMFEIIQKHEKHIMCQHMFAKQFQKKPKHTKTGYFYKTSHASTMKDDYKQHTYP